MEDNHGTTSTTPPQEFILSELLQTRIKVVSHHNEDCQQTVALKLLELAANDPTFTQQQPGYWITRAKWTACNLREHDVIYDRYVDVEPLVWSATDGKFESAFDEYIPAPLPSPEDVVIHRQLLESIASAFDKLTPRQRQVMELKAQFYTAGEIAAMLGVDKSTISYLLTRARRTLSDSIFPAIGA